VSFLANEEFAPWRVLSGFTLCSPASSAEADCWRIHLFESNETTTCDHGSGLHLLKTKATMPSADFCYAIKTPCGEFSRKSATHSRSPEVSSTAFRAQPPDLQPAPLMDMGFGSHLPARPPPYASYPVLVHRLALLLQRFFQTPPRDGALALR
jgi:hypothetical protein